MACARIASNHMVERYKKLTLLSVLIFFMVFGWKITPKLDISVLSTIPIYIYALTKPGNIKTILSNTAIYSCIFIISIAYFVSISFLNDPSTLQWALRTFRAAISFGAIHILCYYNENNEERKNKADILLALSIAITIHAIIVIVTHFHAPLRSIIYQITQAHLYVNEMTLMMDNRPLGLTYSLSITSFLYFVCSAILVNTPSRTIIGITLKIAGLIISTLACLLTARTGVLFFPLLILFLPPKASKLGLKHVLWLVGGLATVIAVHKSLTSNPELIETLNLHRLIDAATFLVAPMDSYFGQQYFPMWHLPDHIYQLLAGNSLTGREEGYYVDSDVGYVLAIYGTGLVGLLLMMLPIIAALWTTVNLTGEKSGYTRLAFVALTSYLILNAKELALLTRTVWPVVCIFISISLLRYINQRKQLDEAKTAQQTS